MKYLWRIEPDVLFSGDISQARDAISADLARPRPASHLPGTCRAQLLVRARRRDVDVLLPFAMSKATAERGGYPQFHKNDRLLDGLKARAAAPRPCVAPPPQTAARAIAWRRGECVRLPGSPP